MSTQEIAMLRLSEILWGTGAALLCVMLLGCSDDDTCRHDFDCAAGQVCEPNGCAPACTTNQQCAAPTLCRTRQVEDGKVCRS